MKTCYQGIPYYATHAGGHSMSVGLCPTKLPVAWEERTDLPLVPATGQAPVLTRLAKSQAPELARLEQEFCAYNICTSEGCE